jgi:hypothetical protein
MHELQRFLTATISTKRNLKEIYYTTRSESLKIDAKKLVVTTIAIQQTIEELLTLWRKNKLARKILQDKKAQLNLVNWTKGLPKRVEDFKQKSRRLKGEHLSKYYEILNEYLETIASSLTNWLEDINEIRELPSVPKE